MLTFWEQGYAAGDVVDVLLASKWTAGTVDAGWQPAPGFGVDVQVAAGLVTAAAPNQIRHGGAADFAGSTGPVVLRSPQGDRWSGQLIRAHGNGLAEVALDHVAGSPVLVKTTLLRHLGS